MFTRSFTKSLVSQFVIGASLIVLGLYFAVNPVVYSNSAAAAESAPLNLTRITQDTFSFDVSNLHADFDHNYIAANTRYAVEAHDETVSTMGDKFCFLAWDNKTRGQGIDYQNSDYNNNAHSWHDSIGHPLMDCPSNVSKHEEAEHAQNSSTVTIDQPVVVTVTPDEPKHDKITEPPALKEDKPESTCKGNPGNLKNVGNAGEKDNKGMDENLSPRGDGSGNGQHGNSDNPDKGKNH